MLTWRFFGPLLGACAIAGVMIALLAPHHGNTVLDPVAKAADTTAAAGTAEFGIAGSFGADGQSIAMNGSGAVDMSSQRMRMSLSFPLPGVGNSEMEEIFDGNAFYMRFPAALASRVPGGKQWMKLDLDSLGKAAGVDIKSMMRANQSNPSDFLQALKGVGTSKVVAEEDIGGTATTHYRATIDLAKAANRIPDKKTADSVKQMFSTGGVSSLPVDVWIDRSGRVRREHISFSADGTSMDMTISYTRFGVPVDTTPPPSDQVMDAGGLLGSG